MKLKQALAAGAPLLTATLAQGYGTAPASSVALPKPGHKHKASNPLNVYSGSEAQPGKVLDKAERLRRAESRTNLTEEAKIEEQKRDEETGFRHLFEKISECLQKHFEDVGVALAPEAAANAVQKIRTGNGPYNIRHLIMILMAFLAVFGSLSVVLNHLLDATRVSAQCNASTVIFPVTYTYTTSIFVSPTACIDPAGSTLGSASTAPAVTRTTTSTHFSILTVTETSTQLPETTSSTSPYLFTGSTSWINGHSPSSGVSIVIATTTIYTAQPTNPPAQSTSTSSSQPPNQPGPSSAASSSISFRTTTIRSTLTKTQTVIQQTATVTPPLYTSTSSSVVTHLTLTTHITRTSTISLLTTMTKSSYTGVGSQGWNGTSSPGVDTGAGTGGIPTTLTGIYYIASSGTSGLTTYSTTTVRLTTTIFGTLPSDTTINLGGTAPSSTSGTSTAPYAASNGTSLGAAGTSGTLPSPTTPSGASGFTTSPPYTVPTFSNTEYGYGPPSSVASVVLSNSSSSGNDVGAVGFTSGTTSEVSTTRFASSTSLSNISGGSTLTWNTSTTFLSVGGTAPNPLSTASSGTVISPAATSTEATMTTSLSTGYGYGAPSPSAGYGGVGDPSVRAASIVTSPTPLSSVTPSTQLLSSFGTGFANGAGPPPSSTLLTTSNSTSGNPTAPSASPTESACGERGDFLLTFDDLPTFSGSNQTDITQAPPVWNPYHHLTFSDGYVYAPLPKEPYLPHSGDKLAVFLGNGTGKTLTPSAMSPSSQGGEPGEISDGPYESNSAFWFDARSAFVGCDNRGPADCILNATGYTWDATAKDEVPTYSHIYNIPACSTSENCQLNPIDFTKEFASLSGLQLRAFVSGQQVMFFLDDLALTWSNNTCNAGMTRQTGGGAGPGWKVPPGWKPPQGRMRSVRRSITR